MAEGLFGIADVEKNLAEAEVQRRPVREGDPFARDQRLHLPDQRIAGLEALEVGLTEQDPRRIGEGPGGLLHRLHRLGLAAELHEQRAAVGDRVHLRGAGQRGGAVVGRERRLELAHRLEDLAHRIVRLGALRRRKSRSLRRVERFVEPVELFQRERCRRKRPRMARREGQERLQRMQGVGMAMARGVDRGEIDIGVGEMRLKLDGAARHGLGAVVFALVEHQVREVAVDLGVVGLEVERRAPALLRLGRPPEAFQGVGEVVERLGVVRLERERPFEAEPAFVELELFLQDDAEVVPGGREAGGERDCAARRLLALGEQALLAAHLGEVAEIDGRRARRPAGLAHMRDREVEIAERIGHEAEEVGRVRLPRPDSEHLPARHLGFVRPTLAPRRAGALDGLGDVEQWGRVRTERGGHRPNDCSRRLRVIERLD